MGKKNWQEYLSEVEEWLMDCPILAKIQLMKGLREEVMDFIQHMPDSTYEDLIELFGPPETVARQLLDAIPPAERRAAQKNKWVGVAIVIAILCTIIAQMGIMLWREMKAPKDRVREIIYVSQPYYVPDGAIKKG